MIHLMDKDKNTPFIVGLQYKVIYGNDEYYDSDNGDEYDDTDDDDDDGDDTDDDGDKYVDYDIYVDDHDYDK